jgi:hypothetical protein
MFFSDIQSTPVLILFKIRDNSVLLVSSNSGTFVACLLVCSAEDKKMVVKITGTR